tara:strand:+ start:43761 stop:44159 length:399 start_codon:yes stop_codon:yes gene_type:complete
MKYVINERFGGFGLSQKALEYLRDEKGWKVAPPERCKNLYHSDTLKLIEEGYQLYDYKCSHGMIGPILTLESDRELSFRSNPDVVEVVEKLGEEANDRHAGLVIKETDYEPSSLEIHDYDGMETLQTIPERF